MDKFLSSTIISRLLRYVRDGILWSIANARNLFCDLYQIPFLWLEMRYIAMNHFTSERFEFSKIVPTLQEKLWLQAVQWNLPLFDILQWCLPQYGQTTSCCSPFPQRVSMIALRQTSSLLKYIVIAMSELNLLKSIITYALFLKT